MKYAEKCPKCGGKVQTKSLRKSIGLGFINIPVAQFCLNPTCDWYQDFSEARKPEEIKEDILQIKIPRNMKKFQGRLPGVIKENRAVLKGAIAVTILSLLLMYILRVLF